MRNHRPQLLAALLFVVALAAGCHGGAHCPPGPWAPGGVSFSGMAKLGPGTFVVVHDLKRPATPVKHDDDEDDDDDDDCACVPAAVGLVTLREGQAVPQVAYRPLKLKGVHPAPNDLEAVCAVPGLPNEVLAAESKPWQGSGSIWRLRIDVNRATATAVGRIDLPANLPDEVEGMTVLPPGPDGVTRLVLGLRGGGDKPGKLWVGVLDPWRNALHADGDVVDLVPPADGWPPGGRPRGCADLLLRPAADGRPAVLLAVAATDPGDGGPFRSVVYEAAEIVNGRPVVLNPGRAVAVMDGLKVEALADGVTVSSGGQPLVCPLTIATDDEALGGAWRPILPATTVP